jgi:hypothetical protein
MESSGLFSDALQLLVLVFRFVDFNSAVHVVMATLQHPVDQAGQQVRHRSDGFGRPEFGV